jgi:hypothetical protein
MVPASAPNGEARRTHPAGAPFSAYGKAQANGTQPSPVTADISRLLEEVASVANLAQALP